MPQRPYRLPNTTQNLSLVRINTSKIVHNFHIFLTISFRSFHLSLAIELIHHGPNLNRCIHIGCKQGCTRVINDTLHIR
jgi:hypothetical protein